jgi:hypothetical protein
MPLAPAPRLGTYEVLSSLGDPTGTVEIGPPNANPRRRSRPWCHRLVLVDDAQEINTTILSRSRSSSAWT